MKDQNLKAEKDMYLMLLQALCFPHLGSNSLKDQVCEAISL